MSEYIRLIDNQVNNHSKEYKTQITELINYINEKTNYCPYGQSIVVNVLIVIPVNFLQQYYGIGVNVSSNLDNEVVITFNQFVEQSKLDTVVKRLIDLDIEKLNYNIHLVKNNFILENNIMLDKRHAEIDKATQKINYKYVGLLSKLKEIKSAEVNKLTQRINELSAITPSRLNGTTG